MEKDIRTLRGKVNSVEACAQRFKEAEALAQGLFTGEGCVPLPYFTPHDETHCLAVEDYLDNIIWGGGKPGEHDFVPTAEEAMYLLSAVWLHDVGMMYGIREGEDVKSLADPTVVMEIRRDHEVRAVRYVHEVWKKDCEWSDDEKTSLTSICAYHRRHRSIGDFEPVRIAGKHDGKSVRLVILAALLRLADACHEDQSRAPGSLLARYFSLGMPDEAAVHWQKAKLITTIKFDHASRRITVVGQCPPKFDFGLGEFDLEEIVQIVRKDIEMELQSIHQILLRYPNTYFGGVDREIYCPFVLKLDEEKQYLAVWPYLLDKPSGSTEAAAALVQMLLFAVSEAEKSGSFGETWENNVFSPIMNKTRELRSVDFMIRNLCQEVKDILSSGDKSPQILKQYLERFLSRINENCQKMAGSAQTLVGPDDVLVVYGYCRNIAEFLRNLPRQNRNVLYIVDFDDKIEKARLGPDEDQEIWTYANRLGFAQVVFVSPAAFPEALNDLQRREIPCKVLLGTHGVLKSQDSHCREFLCRVGSYILALAADAAKKKGLRAKVVVFAQRAQFLTNGESDEEVAKPESLFSTEDCERHPVIIGASCLTPKIDFVPKDLVDLVVTEEGVLEPAALSFGSVQATNKSST